MFGWMRPRERLTAEEVERGLRMVVADGTWTQIMATLIGGPFLVAFALNAGASNKIVGLLAAIGPLSQLLQLPTIALIHHLRRRKALAVVPAALSRLIWLGIATIPWTVSPPNRLTALLVGLCVAAGLGTISGAAWNPWMRDFIPEDAMSALWARRLALATLASALVGLAAGQLMDVAIMQGVPMLQANAYVFLAGTCAGLISLAYLTRIPEPAMPEVRRRALHDVLREPLQDRGYRNVIRFLGAWSFAVNLAAPFYVVYMLQRIGLTLGQVMALTVLSQLINAVFLRLWGRLSDRFGDKAVLNLSCSLFLLTLILWPFTNLPNAPSLTVPLLVGIHVLSGVASAGVTLCSGTLALKAAPRGEATAYLAANSVWSGVVAAVAPVLAGTLADWFADQRVRLLLSWTSTAEEGGWVLLTPLDLRGIDFLFLLAFVSGLYALHRLLAVREAEVVPQRVVASGLYMEMLQTLRSVSTAPGVRQVVDFPFAALGMLMPERRRARRRR
jgi:MFS-type transporter involved in bile tolerance (Atg22 family)